MRTFASVAVICVIMHMITIQAAAQPSVQTATVYLNDGSYVVVPNVLDTERGIAWASIDDRRSSTGWTFFSIDSSSEFSDSLQFAAAGFLEGYMYAELISAVIANFRYKVFSNQNPDPRLINWLTTQEAFVREEIRSNGTLFMHHVALTMFTFDGLVQGYAQAYAERGQAAGLLNLNAMDFYLFQSSGDLYDLIPAIVPSQTIPWQNLTKDEFFAQYLARSSCSSLVRLLPDKSDIVFAHATWTDYGSMVRSFKNVHHGIRDMGARRHIFSSKPGLLYSKDDFYLLDSGLAVMETTNGVLDNAVYAKLTTSSLLTWQRVPAVNRVANNGAEWVYYMNQLSSGTYGNQWMILDLKLFKPAQPLVPGLFTILEQIPGLSVQHDVTEVLSTNGFWASYNIPYDSSISDASGFTAACAKQGAEFCYNKASRALIFARDAPNVKSFDDVKKLIRYNDYKNDPLSQNNPNYAIAARTDLSTSSNAKAFGATDAKVSSVIRSLTSLSADIQSGPSHDQQSPFTWSTSNFNNVTHQGEPDMWNFDWITFTL